LMRALERTAMQCHYTTLVRSGLGARHGFVMLENGVRPVIGTSGVSLDDNRELDAVARRVGLGGLVVPNFSRGVVLMPRLCEEAVDRKSTRLNYSHEKISYAVS